MQIIKNVSKEHAPGPTESFLALKLLKNSSAGKNTLEKSDENGCPFPQKISEHVPDMKHFQKPCCYLVAHLSSYHEKAIKALHELA